MEFSPDLRNLISSYTAGNINVTKFRMAFVPLFVGSNKADSEAFSLALNMESTYAEFVEGLVNETELKNRLGHLVQPPQIILGFAPSTTGNDSPFLNGQSSINSSSPRPLSLAASCHA